MTTPPLARNVRRIGHLDLPGGGQVVVQGNHAFIGHMKQPHGTTIVDVGDPSRPRVVAQIELPDSYSHTHKVRVVGDLMYVNVEQNERHFLRKGEALPGLRTRLAGELPPAVSRADPYGHVGGGAARGTPHRSRGRRRARSHPRPAACLHVGVRRHRSFQHPAALDVPGQRDGLAVEPLVAPLRRASVPREAGRQPGLPDLVRRRAADRRYLRSVAAQGGRLLHS